MTDYKAIKVDGVKRDEHRYIMEQHLGRKLGRDELVHHKNENKRDNQIENLVIMSRSEHARLHQLGKTPSEQTKKALSEALKGRPNLYCRKLSDEDVASIRSSYIPRSPEFGGGALAKKYGVMPSTISKIIHNKRRVNEE